MALATAALVVVLLGVSADASADSQESLYAKESMLYEEILAGDSDEELVTPVDTELTAKTPALDVNADNGGPINVPAASVQSEVFKFAGGDYSATVVRKVPANPHELPGEQQVVRDSYTLAGNIQGPVFKKCGLKEWSSTEYLQFKGMNEAEIVNKFTGDIAPKEGEFMEVDSKLSTHSKLSIPDSFDWRDHMANSQGMKVQERGKCGACYAFAAASAMSDRFFLASRGRINVAISPQSLLNCANGCKGGSAADAFKVMLTNAASPTWCAAYHAKKGQCGASCGQAAGYKTVPQAASKTGTLGIMGRTKVDAMMYQIWKYGPVYMRMVVYSDFPSYHSGVYKHGPGTKVRGDHAIKVVGWGSEGGTAYWIAQNSWGATWGEKGFFKIARGVDESAIESRGIFWAIPDAGKVCAGSNACQNGGSYTKSCGCKCTDGYSGPLCNKCNLKCSGVGFTGHHEVGKCSCACAPGYFDGIIDGRPAKCGLKIAASSPVVKAAIKVPPCKDHPAECPSWKDNNYCTAKSRYHEYTAQKCPLSCGLCDKKKSAQIKVTAQGKFGFQYGDMLVAVPAGQRPWVANGGWAPGSVSQFVCGPDGSYQRNLFCDETNEVTLKISTAGAFDVYFYRYKGKNALNQSRGWGADATKMSFKACTGAGACVFPAAKLPKPSKLSDEEKAE